MKPTWPPMKTTNRILKTRWRQRRARQFDAIKALLTAPALGTS